MILKTVFGLSVLLSVSLDNSPPPSIGPAPRPELSVRHRDAALLPLVHRATQCILRRIGADPRSGDALRADEVAELIADAMAACDRPLRVIVSAHDRMYGPGSGEAFVRGPFLDVLPAAVFRNVRLRTQAR